MFTNPVSPTFDAFLAPYKKQASEFKQNEDITHTKAQHELAKCFSFEDWQRLHYFFKNLYKELENINFTEGEWFYFYDIMNGWAISLVDADMSHLLMNVVDGDRYDSLGYKHFKEMSFCDSDFGNYKPSQSILNFVEKIKKLNPKQVKAVFVQSLSFWNRTFTL